MLESPGELCKSPGVQVVPTPTRTVSLRVGAGHQYFEAPQVTQCAAMFENSGTEFFSSSGTKLFCPSVLTYPTKSGRGRGIETGQAASSICHRKSQNGPFRLA